MARFTMELPESIVKDFERIYNDADKIFGEMTQAGARVVYNNIKGNLPEGIRKSNMINNLDISKVYKTPSDDGINTKVMFAGYFINENGVKTPAPLVANVFEYGRSNAPFPKQPFLRRAFNKQQIEAAMMSAQKTASGGLLDESDN